MIFKCCFSSSKKYEFKGKHVLITGGSKGLGFSLAKQLALKHESFVTVCSRTKDELDQATEIIKSTFPPNHSGKIQGIVCDVTKFDQIEHLINQSEDQFGRISCLICCAGQALCGNFLEQPVDVLQKQIDLNYLGSAYPTKVLSKRMVDRKQKDGKICFISSQCGLTAFQGYSAYAPSKFAIRGLAEALRHEFLPYHIGVHIAFLGNIDTPGFEIEQKVKPAITKRIESFEVLQKPDDVARAVIHSLEKNEFAIYGGNLSGYFLGRVSRGLAPYGNNVFVDVLLTPFIVLFAWGHRTFVIDRAHSYFSSG